MSPSQNTSQPAGSELPAGGEQPSGGGGPSKPPRPVTPGLYLVATPIGNARDITLRALDILAAADVVACEDTRTSGRLLGLYGLSRPMVPYHEHNAAKMRPKLLSRLRAGATVALVSDAGTPLISDPGFKLVRACRAEGLPVSAAPGASALLAALAVGGLPTDRFLFAGFLPSKAGQRRSELADLAAVPASLVFYESPRRLAASLADMAAVLGGAREAAMARELTKLYEEVRSGALAALAAEYAAASPPKGEVAIVVGPPPPPAVADDETVERLLAEALASGTSARDAARAVAEATGRPRREVYSRATALARESR